MAIVLGTLRDLDNAIGTAREVTISGYALAPGFEASLEARARGGVATAVTLASGQFHGRSGPVALENAATAARLRAAGAVVCLSDGVHLKAAVVDGVAWLVDRNFAASGSSVIVRDDAAEDVARVRAVIAGADDRSLTPGALSLSKRESTRAEAEMIRTAPPGGISASTESFGYGEVEAALASRLRAGDRVRLVVDVSLTQGHAEAEALASLRTLGADIRATRGVDKLALTDAGAWIGSANATYAGPRVAPQTDWGLVSADPLVTLALRDRFETLWNAAAPLVER